MTTKAIQAPKSTRYINIYTNQEVWKVRMSFDKKIVFYYLFGMALRLVHPLAEHDQNFQTNKKLQ